MTDAEIEIMLKGAKKRLEDGEKTLKDLDERKTQLDWKKRESAKNEAKIEIKKAKEDISFWEKKADEQNNNKNISR